MTEVSLPADITTIPTQTVVVEVTQMLHNFAKREYPHHHIRLIIVNSFYTAHPLSLYRSVQ